ncbi:MAG: preprotein translocase subunit SecY [Euryarchaeota archaeon]|nr:preprotein translocase subunit SecY [Euryarchaeota archaeon]
MSKLEMLSPLFRFIPEVRSPKRRIPFKEKIMWSVVALSVYFGLAQIPLYGVVEQRADWLAGLRVVLAGNSGSILHLGIGPIVTAGIVMQLLVGSDLIDLDMTTHEDKKTFQGTQKLLTIFLCVFEAFSMASGQKMAQGSMLYVVIFQMALGGVLIMVMDEVITKWGFGSGVSLFIAGRVSAQVMWRSLSFLPSEQMPGQMIGAISQFIKSFIGGNPMLTREGLAGMDQVLFTILVFFIVVYVVSIRVEIPLSYGKFKGIRGRYPIRFIYASNIPVILTMAMFANVNIMARILNTRGITWLGTFSGNTAVSGLVKYISPPRGLKYLAGEPFQALFYLLAVVMLSMFFAVLWIELTQMGPDAVAKKLQRSGMQIPGFRKDPRILRKVLSRYIPQVTVMGGATVGLIAVFADFTGAVGTGTGILLTVSILQRLYEELMKEQMGEMFPALRRFIGSE